MMSSIVVLLFCLWYLWLVLLSGFIQQWKKEVINFLSIVGKIVEFYESNRSGVCMMGYAYKYNCIILLLWYSVVNLYFLMWEQLMQMISVCIYSTSFFYNNRQLFEFVYHISNRHSSSILQSYLYNHIGISLFSEECHWSNNWPIASRYLATSLQSQMKRDM